MVHLGAIEKSGKTWDFPQESNAGKLGSSLGLLFCGKHCFSTIFFSIGGVQDTFASFRPCVSIFQMQPLHFSRRTSFFK